MKVLSLFLILILSSILPQKSKCPCQTALDEDRPHGANIDNEYTAGTVNGIKGRVLYADGVPVNAAVVEIYEIAEAEKNLRAYQVTESRARRAACLANKDGYFCFTGLSSGRYTIKAGTRGSAGINWMSAKVKLERRWWIRWFRSGKDIELILYPGS